MVFLHTTHLYSGQTEVSGYKSTVLRSFVRPSYILKFERNCYHEFSRIHLLSTLLQWQVNLETLRFSACGITDEACFALAKALTSKLSHLRELDLSENKLGDAGVMVLSAALENNCSDLVSLKMNDCDLTYEGCSHLASALASNPSHLRELDLSKNKLDDVEMLVLAAGLENSSCKLEKLRLVKCGLTDEGFVVLNKALRSNPSHLKELDLSENSLCYLHTMLLSSVLESPYWELKTLKLVNCSFTEEGGAALMSALRSNPSHLRELDLSKNNIGYLTMMVLSSAMEIPYWELEILRLNDCGITDDGFAALGAGLRSNPSYLRELDLSKNKLGEFGVHMLSIALEMPYCQLETLRLVSCDITGNGWIVLVSALRSNPSHLRNLDLSGNNLECFEIKLLSEVLESPYCKLETLKLRNCNLKDEECVSLASALRLKISKLRELDLSENKLGDSGVKAFFAELEGHLSKFDALSVDGGKQKHLKIEARLQTFAI
nr:ribonuclease inhibitor-like isoform X4 [Danio rerio]|eukprot:XP_009290118.1 ribonuclease inhibitor-like isoform X4 [Danio rerio]